MLTEAATCNGGTLSPSRSAVSPYTSPASWCAPGRGRCKACIQVTSQSECFSRKVFFTRDIVVDIVASTNQASLVYRLMKHGNRSGVHLPHSRGEQKDGVVQKMPEGPCCGGKNDAWEEIPGICQQVQQWGVTRVESVQEAAEEEELEAPANQALAEAVVYCGGRESGREDGTDAGGKLRERTIPIHVSTDLLVKCTWTILKGSAVPFYTILYAIRAGEHNMDLRRLKTNTNLTKNFPNTAKEHTTDQGELPVSAGMPKPHLRYRWWTGIIHMWAHLPTRPRQNEPITT